MFIHEFLKSLLVISRWHAGDVLGVVLGFGDELLLCKVLELLLWVVLLEVVYDAKMVDLFLQCIFFGLSGSSVDA